jgi:hypothetical protein
VSSGLVLRGLDGASPFGFLAALGTLRLVELALPGENRPRMRWMRRSGFRPQITGLTLSEQELCDVLAKAPSAPIEDFSVLGKNITVGPSQFREFAEQAQLKAMRTDHRAADFAACFGSEVCINEKLDDRIQYTAFCFITGSGHQDFLATAASLSGRVTPEHINEALFGEWRYAEKGLSFGWDPADAREYALRWRDPGPEGVLTVWGANRLAIEALPLLPAVASRQRLNTTGFALISRVMQFTWPIWDGDLSSDSIKSLLSLSELQQEIIDRRLFERGILEVYRAQRVRIGSGANFKIRFRPARAI